MTPWDAVVLGLIQGATEFLPVSSSGHLVMGQALLGITVPGVLFEVVVHLATLVSIVVVYRARLARLVVGLARRERDAVGYAGRIVLATVPAGLVGVLGTDVVERLFDAPWVAGGALLVTGSFLWTSRVAQRRHPEPVAEGGGGGPGWGVALLIGVAQAFALVPGISRSGATVVAGLWLGVEAREAAAFSFLMAIPAIAGAAVLKGPEMAAGTALGTTSLALGGVVAAVTGVLAIRSFVALLGRKAFHWFAPYCWLAGLGFLAFLSLR